MIKLIIADDHAIVRKGLKEILSDNPDIVVSGEAETGQELLNMVRKGKYDIILLDITMPDRNGLDILKQLKAENHGIPVLILSMHPEDQYAMRAYNAGASGYLTKKAVPGELLNAIVKLSQGGKYVSATFAESLVDSINTDYEKPLHKKLTDREFEVLYLLGSGKRISEIAKEKFLSVSTISTYKRRIMKKLELKTTAGLIQYALNNKILD